MARILGTGIATLDIINTVDGYPSEDSEVRALAQAVRVGGNTANTLSVLAQAGHECRLAGVLAGDMNGRRIASELELCGVDLRHVRRVEHGAAPTSYIVLNQRNGSRSIVHFRDLPEFSIGDFMDIDDIASCDWLHFEARNCDDLAVMLAYARSVVTDQPISLEVEKERDGLDALWIYPDIIIFSRAFVQGRGFTAPEDFLREARSWAPQAILILPWGDQGAWALSSQQALYRSPAFPPDQVVDTLAAGDTFNAGLIQAMLCGRSLEDALRDACQLAGRKVGQHGLQHLLAPIAAPNNVLCPLNSLPDPGSRGFEVDDDGTMRAIFVVRKGMDVYGYLNVCPHLGVKLNESADAFLDEDGRHVRCALHGALFDLADGRCIAGPCLGAFLTRIDIDVQRGQLICTSLLNS
ncbi:MAG: PfkB family carbohydrate kinase [Halothiobacillaceae bacterium]|nr:PfkB family carbohydrate kinase [Halothiobacillaceae bacterium]